MKIWSTPHSDMGKNVNYNGPKVDPLGDVPRALPLVGAILRVQLAKCWKPRVSGGTRSCHTLFVGCRRGQ
jgi:hypothetical protein